MSSTRSTIDLIISGSLSGLTGATATARAELAALEQRAGGADAAAAKAAAALRVLSLSMLGITAASSAIQVIGGIYAVLQQLLPIVLLAPAAIGALGASFLTLKLGFQGFGDAVKKGGADLAKLAPQARAAAVAIRALAPAFHEVQQATQNALFTNIAADVQKLGSIYLPILRKQLPLIAAGFNEMGRSLAFALQQTAVSKAFTTLFTNTATLIHNARNALGAFAAGFVTLAGAGATYLPRLGTAIDGAAQAFLRFVNRITTDGSFQTFVDHAIAGFKDLFHIIGDLGSILVSVFSGLAGPQGDVLASLRSTTDAVAAFLKTVDAQTALSAFGDALRTVADVTRNVLLAALKDLAPIIADLAPFVATAAQSFGDLLLNALKIVAPFLQAAAKFLGDNKEIAIPLVPIIAALALKFISLGSAVRLLPFVILFEIAQAVDKINLAAANNDPKKLDDMAHSLHNIVGAGQEILTLDFPKIFGEISTQVGQTNDKWAQGQAPIQQWFDKVKTSFDTDFVGALRTGSAHMDDFFAGLRDKVIAGAQGFVQPFLDAPGKIATAFNDTSAKISTAIGDIGATIAAKAVDIWTGFTSAVSGGFESVKAFFSQTPFQMGQAIGERIGDIIAAGLTLMTSFGTAIHDGVTTVVDFAATVPGLIGGAMAEFGSALAQVAADAWNFFFNGAVTGVDNTVGEAQQAPAKVGNALSDFGGTLLRIATDAWTGFLQFARDTIAQDVAEAQALPGKIGSALSSLGGVLLKAAIDAWNGFLKGARDQIAIAEGEVRAVPGKISAALGNLGSLLVGAGRSVIDGLLSGIKAGVQAMYDFVSGIAAGIAARKGPISHDKVVLKPAGLALMAGLLDGLKSGHADILDFTSTIAGSIDASIAPGGLIASARAFETRAAASGSASANGPQSATQGPPTYVIPISIGDEVVRTVRGEIDSSNREVRRTVTAGSGTTAG